jgi:hypothetical protein
VVAPTGADLAAPGSILKPGVIKVEVSLDAVHDLGADRALVAEPHDLSLGLEELADQPLVGE